MQLENKIALYWSCYCNYNKTAVGKQLLTVYDIWTWNGVFFHNENIFFLYLLQFVPGKADNCKTYSTYEFICFYFIRSCILIDLYNVISNLYS